MLVCLRRCGVWLFFLGMLAAGPAAFAQERGAEAVNRSSAMQMLAERITRSYAMLGQGVNTPRAQRQLEADLRAFDGHLAALRALPLNAGQKQALARVGETWGGFRSAVAQPPSLAGAQVLARGSMELAVASAACTAALRSAVVDRFDAIGLAGSARTLSQRMAKLYFYATWGLKAPEGPANFAAMEEEVRGALDKLAIAPQNDDSTLADLALAQSQWVFFSRALARLSSGEARMQYMNEVAKSSDAVLEVMDGLAVKYAASKEQDWAN